MDLYIPLNSYMTGMVIKIVEEMDKLPASNKQAYKRLFLEVCNRQEAF